MQPDVRAARRRDRWPWLLAGLLWLQYTVVGWWLMAVRHYAISDAMSRTLSAKLMVLSRDPHLGAMGFYWMPFPTVSRVPFVLLAEPFGRAELAGPMTSACFAALTVPALVGIARVLRLSRFTTGAVVLLYAFNPVTVYIAANGMSESTFAFFIALTMLWFLRWRHDGRVESLVVMGLALAGTAMCRYETLLVAPALAVAIAAASERGRRVHAVILAMLPAAAVFAWWMIASKLIVGDGLFWLTASRGTTATPDDAPWLPGDRSLASLGGWAATLVLALAPALIAVIAGSFTAIRRWRTSLAIVGVALFMPAFVTWQVYDGQSWGVPRFFVTTPLIATIGVMWILRTGRTNRVASFWGGVGVGLLAVGAVTGSLYLADPDRSYAEGEFAFFGPLMGKSDADSTVDDSGPDRVFIGDLSQYRRLKRDLDPFLAGGEKVAMDSLQAVPALMTDHPEQFIVPEDRDFEVIMSDPADRFQWIVIQPRTKVTYYRTLLDTLLADTNGGRWEMVRDYGGMVQLYEWVITGNDPRLDEEPEEPTIASASTTTSTTTTTLPPATSTSTTVPPATSMSP